MLRPVSLSPFVHDLLTLGPDLAGPAGPKVFGHGPLHPAGLAEGAAPFAAQSPSRDFGPQHPLGLMPHPALVSSPPLETRLARLLCLPAALTFASYDLAIRATLGAILQSGDAVILDSAICSAMFETVLSFGAHAHRCPPASVGAVERRLRRLSATPGIGQLWVAIPALSAHASAMAEVADLADLCQQFGARLIVDVTQDLGSTAQSGGGVMEVQGCLGRADVVLGSFARNFGARGGFVGLRDPALGLALAGTRSRPLAAAPAATILATLDLVQSAEGRRRRRRLHAISLRLRNHLMADGVPVLGHPSPVVPVRLMPETAVASTALMHSAGVGVSLLQRPAVASHAPRWCLHLTADHTPADIDSLADLIRDVTRSFARR